MRNSWPIEKCSRIRPRAKTRLSPARWRQCSAEAFAIGESASGQLLISHFIESNPGVRLVYGIPLILIVGVAVIAIVVELLGGILFDLDVSTGYRNVFRKLDQMVAEMEELRR